MKLILDGDLGLCYKGKSFAIGKRNDPGSRGKVEEQAVLEREKKREAKGLKKDS